MCWFLSIILHDCFFPQQLLLNLCCIGWLYLRPVELCLPSKRGFQNKLVLCYFKANDYILNSMTSYYIQIHKPICVNNISTKPLKHMCNYYKMLWSHSTWVKVGGQVRCQANENLTNLLPPYHYHNEKNGRLNHSTDKNHMEKLFHKGKSYQPLPPGQKEFNWS